MIHAWIMVNNLHRLDGDPSGHGVVFHAKASEINASTLPDPHRPSNGYHITQFHSMIDEVEYYRQHHWKCEKCGNLIRRSMNRAPQPADCRHNRGKTGCNDKICRYCNHAASCGGKYIKIKEPENFKDKNKKRKSSKGNDSDASMPNSGSSQASKHFKDQDSKIRSIKDFFSFEAQGKPSSKQYVECESNLSEINQQGSSVLPAFETALNWAEFTASSKTVQEDRSKHFHGSLTSGSQDKTLANKTIQDQLREIAALRRRHWETSKDEKSRDITHAASSSKSETSVINVFNRSNDSLDSSEKASNMEELRYYSVKDFSVGVPNGPSQDLINLVSSEDEEENSKVAFELRNCLEHNAGDRNLEELNQNIHVQFIFCPVCNLQFASDGHSALNEHLDRCLIK